MNLKKLACMFLAVLMILAMAVPAMATDITITGGANGSVYYAWMLLNATNSADNTELFAYTLNEDYTDILQAVTGKTTQADIVAYIEALDADGIRGFADDVYAKVKDKAPDATSNNNQFAGVAQGYWLIAETTLGTTGSGATDTYSLIMLDTAGLENITVNTKEDTPEVEKKVKDINDSQDADIADNEWQDSADHDINDVVPFQLTGTVSAKYADYEKYYYAFHDTLSSGLTFDADSVVVKIDNVTVDASKYAVKTTNTCGCTFEVVFEDLKKIEGVTVTADSKIVVEYTATLNENAVIGAAGNPNKVKLEYSNNPYDKSEGKPEDTGFTPEDKVTVFTYKVVVNKVDKDEKPLEGAGFTLYKKDAKTNEYVIVGAEVKGDDMTTFTWIGLDDGDYKLVESTVPAGYNKVDDIYFTIAAKHDVESADPQLTELTANDAEGKKVLDTVMAEAKITGELTTKVINQSGTELPSTGGIGTTIFYIAGAILVVGAVVVMISKKRSSEK